MPSVMYRKLHMHTYRDPLNLRLFEKQNGAREKAPVFSTDQYQFGLRDTKEQNVLEIIGR